MSIDTPPITAQQYEILHGGGAEAAEIAKERLSRRRFLRRSMLAVWEVSTTASVAGALYMLYPSLSGQFGSAQTVGKKSEFPAGSPDKATLDQATIFRRPAARTYIVHLAKDTKFLLKDQDLKDQLHSESVLQDKDGSYWIALYHTCVHLGCTVPFRNDCASFKCPCHGSHYNISGEFLAGPAPRSLDRFAVSFNGDDIVVNTGLINNTVSSPDSTTRLLAPPSVQCSAG